jgi:hypothetical protein
MDATSRPAVGIRLSGRFDTATNATTAASATP